CSQLLKCASLKKRKTRMIQLKAATTTLRTSRCKKARPVFAKRRQLRDELESESSSGSEVHYNITSSDESPVRTTRAKSKAQEAATATTSSPQSDEGIDEAESDGDNLPTNNARKGNDDDAQPGEGDTNAEESSNKDSGAEESNEQGEDSGFTPEARSKRWFL
ncbi:hypothetical protein HAX54_015558, partial [Datura stramonium]|nr:hypothetical protein [Datura stramonium]